MAQPVEPTPGETAVGQLLRQGVYFEQLLVVLKDYLRERNIVLQQDGSDWLVAEIVNKIPRQREIFSTIAEAATYALELYDKHLGIQFGE
jgi:hypothetical protein